MLAFLAALFFAWQALTKANFFYPLWYELLGIDRTIATYGPRNRYRQDFEITTKAERVRLLGEMVAAIHDGGKGLEELVYHAPDGRPIATLLTRPEIVHLQDVARLVDRLRPVGWGAFAGWLLVWGVLLKQRRAMPSVARLLLATLLVLVGGGLIIGLIGPVAVFYRLHTWIFPPAHQWFFYYQDSLMTMMLQAPHIFGYIALAWAGLSLLFFAGMLFFARRLFQRLQSNLLTPSPP